MAKKKNAPKTGSTKKLDIGNKRIEDIGGIVVFSGRPSGNSPAYSEVARALNDRY